MKEGGCSSLFADFNLRDAQDFFWRGLAFEDRWEDLLDRLLIVTTQPYTER